jgi:hypothetical protein
MSSKLEAASSSTFLTNKINIMLNDLNKDFAGLDSRTKEDVIMTFNEIVKKFYKTIEKPLFNYNEIKRGKLPDIEELNKTLKSAEQDLKVIYKEMQSLRQKMAANFNALSAKSIKIKSEIAKTYSDMTDYRLQNQNKDTPAFSDSFNDLSKVDSEDDSYDKEKAFVDTKNNRILGSLQGEAEGLKPNKISIGESSIGTPGNNQEIGAVARDNLQLLADNNLDTWFEFEQVSKREIDTPTILDLKMEFQEEKVFNILETATVAFPTGGYPAIMEIKGSIDGSFFFDLMPYFLGEIAKDSIGNSIIQLGEKDSNPSDSNLLYFFPKKIKYLNIKFIEDTPFFIKTPSGIKSRNAIGIKEIKAKSQKFKPEGQFVSISHLSEKEISKVLLFTEERFFEGYDLTYDYFVSVDNGKDWKEIGASQRVTDGKPEVLNYNIDFFKDSIKTDLPVTQVKLRANLKIEQSEDDAAASATFKSITNTEFKSISGGVKQLPLQQKPIADTIITEIGLGSRGGAGFYKLPSSGITEFVDLMLVQLPLNVFEQGSIALDEEVVYIDNFIWKRVDDLTTSVGTDRHYEYDYLNNIIKFYLDDAGVRKGARPIGDILFKLEREALLLKKMEGEFRAETKFKTSGIKEKIKIYKLSDETKLKIIKLRSRSTIHRLQTADIQEITVTQDTNGKLASQVDYTNGVLEFSGANEFSVDKTKGILYSSSEIDSEEEVLVEIEYKERTDTDFTVRMGEVYIKEEDYKSVPKQFNITVPLSTFVVDLGSINIEKGSMEFTKAPEEIETEVTIEEMEKRFQSSETGLYSIDYRKGLLYLQAAITGEVNGILSAADYYIEYNLGYRVPRSLFQINKEEKLIVFTDDYVADNFTESNRTGSPPKLFKVEYSYADEVKETPGELLPYITPMISHYRLIATPKELIL